MVRTRTILDGEKVRILAVRRKTSVKQIGDRAGLSNAYIYQVLDKDSVTLSTVDAIANAIGCTALDIITVTVVQEAEDYTQVDAPTTDGKREYA